MSVWRDRGVQLAKGTDERWGRLRHFVATALHAELLHAASQRVGVQGENFRGAFRPPDDPTRMFQDGFDVPALRFAERYQRSWRRNGRLTRVFGVGLSRVEKRKEVGSEPENGTGREHDSPFDHILEL